MSNCGCKEPNQPFRIVQSIAERNAIPCAERMDGMVVVVVQDNYKKYMLQGGDNYCNNTKWVEDGVTFNQIQKVMGHKTLLPTDIVVDTDVDVPEAFLNNEHLNTLFPEVIEGFRVSVPSIGTTFTKLSDNTWLISNNLSNE